MLCIFVFENKLYDNLPQGISVGLFIWHKIINNENVRMNHDRSIKNMSVITLLFYRNILQFKSRKPYCFCKEDFPHRV